MVKQTCKQIKRRCFEVLNCTKHSHFTSITFTTSVISTTIIAELNIPTTTHEYVKYYISTNTKHATDKVLIPLVVQLPFTDADIHNAKPSRKV